MQLICTVNLRSQVQQIHHKNSAVYLPLSGVKAVLWVGDLEMHFSLGMHFILGVHFISGMHFISEMNFILGVHLI